MPGLDNRTIIFVASLVYVVLAGAAAISSAALRKYRGPGYWAAGISGWALFALLIFLRGSIPAWLSVVVSNTGLVVSLCLVAHGLRLFLEASLRLRLHVAVSLASLVGQVLFTLVQDSFAGRAAVASGAFAIVTADMALAVLRSRMVEEAPAARFVVATCAVLFAVNGLRTVAALVLPSSDLFQRHWFFTATLLVIPLGTLALVLSLLTLAMTRFAREVEARGVELGRANDDLRTALENVRVLSGLLRICAWCKRIVGDDGAWHQMEAYVRQHSEAEFTHGMCPDCAARMRAEIPRSVPSPHRPPE